MNWAACDARAVQALCTHHGINFAKAQDFLLARQLKEEAGNDGNLGEVGEVGEGGATSAGTGNGGNPGEVDGVGGVDGATSAAAAAATGAEQHGAGHSVADEPAAAVVGVASAAAAAAGEGGEEDDDDPSQFHNAYLNESYRAHPATEHESCLKEVVLQLAHPTKPKKIHLAWNIGKQGERTPEFWQDIIDSKKPITFSCGGSWCLVRVTGFRFFEAARGAHEAALKSYRDRVTEVMPLDHTRAEVVDVAQALASYKWIYIGRLLEKGKKSEEQLVEEFATKEEKYGVRAIEVELVPEMCYIQHARSFSKEARAHRTEWKKAAAEAAAAAAAEAAVAVAAEGGGGAAGAGGGGGGGGGGDEKPGQKRRHE
jgi:hypothetical protein